MALEFASAPVRDPIAEENEAGLLMLGRKWIDYFSALTLRIETSAQRLNKTAIVANGTSIGTTPVPLGALAGGLYRLTYYFRITQPASVSSSLSVTLGWTDGGVTCAYSTPLPIVNGNTVSTVRGDTIMIRSDQAAPLTYSTTYVSVGGTPMLYSLDLVVEQMT